MINKQSALASTAGAAMVTSVMQDFVVRVRRDKLDALMVVYHHSLVSKDNVGKDINVVSEMFVARKKMARFEQF